MNDLEEKPESFNNDKFKSGITRYAKIKRCIPGIL